MQANICLKWQFHWNLGRSANFRILFRNTADILILEYEEASDIIYDANRIPVADTSYSREEEGVA